MTVELAQAPRTTVDVTEHLRLVHWCLARHGYRGRTRTAGPSRRKQCAPAHGALDYDDLFSVGCMGLMQAARRFDPTRGVKFSTYALWWVRHYVQREVENCSSIVRVPVHRQAELRRAGQRTRPVRIRLDLPLHDGDEGSSSLLDVLADDAPSPEDEADTRGAASQLAELMDRARLTPRERFVLRLRAEREATLQQIGERLGVGRERARQIEAEALGKLRRAAGVPSDAPYRSLADAPQPRNPNRLDRQGPCMTSRQPEI